jgi:TorA maturation chaperone TorD
VNEAGAERPEAVALEPEEQARANLYGLVSRLFYGPPDPNLLAEVSRSPAVEGEREDTGGENALARAWLRLHEACRSAYLAIVRQEYDSLFVGVGKAVVTPYLSAYAEPQTPDRYLLRLREQLRAWGLGRRDSVFEVEDHISGVSDVMRWLIQGGRPLAEQRDFFERFVYAGAVPFFAAVQKAPGSSFYRHVAAFAGEYFEVEMAALGMDDAN